MIFCGPSVCTQKCQGILIEFSTDCCNVNPINNHFFHSYPHVWYFIIQTIFEVLYQIFSFDFYDFWKQQQ